MNALPITSVGLRMEDDVIRIAAGLRLGAPLCHPHSCRLCGRAVDTFATHGLSCTKSAGRHFRHAAINNIIHRSLSSAKIPSSLEPPGLSRSDGKQPDGITIAPWKAGRTLIWDATCCDTFAASNVGLASKEAGSAAEVAERRKKIKYEALSQVHHFVPVAIETTGVFGPEAREFIKEVAKRVKLEMKEEKAHSYLLQQISVAVQRGNAAAILGTSPHIGEAP